MSWGFQPDASRALALRDEINTRLISSLRYVFGEVGDALGCDADRFAAWVAALEQAVRPDPLIHVLFHSIVADVQAGDIDAARRAAERMLTLGAAREGLTVNALDAEDDAPRPAVLFARFADIEDDNRLDFVAPDPALAGDFKTLIEGGIELIRRNDPALDGELRTLLTDVLLASQAPSHLFTTAALSCFQNWGSLLVNPNCQRDVIDVVETLAHEATHLTLFALALDEPLLNNDPNARYFSPLRQAQRSMDGVYHATIVSARVTRALLQQARATDDPEVRAVALERAEIAAVYFDEGLLVIEPNADFSPLGRQVLDDCKAFMAEARTNLANAA